MVMGEADISLISDESDTVINYALKADVGGRLAGIGSNLLEVTMQKYANDFVGRFNSIVCEKTTTKISTNHSSENFPLRDAVSASASSDSGGSKEKNKSMSLLWVFMGAIILLVLIWLFR